MCTISWLFSSSGYHVFFNRDERRARPLAIPPCIKEENKVKAIMPIDPKGSGTWCAVNEYGFTFALLNFYQGRLPKGRLMSRGKLVRACAGFDSVEKALAYLRSQNHAKIAPYSLLCFSPSIHSNRPSLSSSNPGVRMIRWDGKVLTDTERKADQEGPLMSSAVNYEQVFASRLNVYHEIIGSTAAPESQVSDFLRLHASHSPERSAQSVCMHRDEAHTVSFSHIEVGLSEINYSYADGAPCKTPVENLATIKRIQCR